MIKKCSCNHPYQDKKHGKGRRVHTKCTSGYRCTVCTAVSGGGEGKSKKGKK